MSRYIPVEPEKWAEMVKAMAENERLKAEVERLRKAGDAMALCITEFRCGKYGNALDKVGGFYVWQDWLAAKEGKQS